MLKEGEKAPDFELNDQNGTKHRLSDYDGKKRVIYFYPKDNTPGCTEEACSIKDLYDEFLKKGMIIFGISSDSEESHRRFAEKYKLPFTLLADIDKKVVKLYDVYGEKKFMGKTYVGIHRITYIINEEREIMKVFTKVKTMEHGKQILESL